MAMVSAEPVLGKRKRVSKKNKKAWRKHTQIGDVEKFLEERLREERTGGKPSDKTNTDLFYIDKSDIFQTSKSKLANMKCHSESQMDTRVAPVVGYTGPKKKKKKRKGSITISPNKENSKKGLYDIWGAASNTIVPEPDIYNSQDMYNASQGAKLDPCLAAPVLHPGLYKSTETKISAVEVPHPGASYNPTFTAHQELLQSALDVEEKREKSKAKATRDAAPPMKITEADYIKEMSIGLPGHQSESESEVAETESGVVLKAANNRKTKTQRNKEKAEKLRVEELAAARMTKQHVHQLNRIKSIKKEIRLEAKETASITAERQAKRSANDVRPGKYGPGKLQPEQPDFVLPEEVSSSLRQLVSPANNLQDRFASLQKRNLVEVRKQVAPHRKYKIKYVEKWRVKLPEELKELTKTRRRKKIKITE